MTEVRAKDAGGSKINTINTIREAKVYPLFEAEMTSLGVLNFFSSLCFSISTFFLSFWFALKLQKEVTEDMGNVTGAGEFMLLTGPKVCIALALVFALFGGVIFKIRGGQLKKIKSEAVQRVEEMENNANT